LTEFAIRKEKTFYSVSTKQYFTADLGLLEMQAKLTLLG
jgi:hypothetical protein